MKDFLKEEVNVKVDIEKVRKIKTRGEEEIVVAEIDSWEEKKEIMRKKGKLKKGIFIDDDLAKQERGIQMKLKEGGKSYMNFSKSWISKDKNRRQKE